MESSLYPLEFKPIFREKIWGGNKIQSKLGFDIGKLDNCGELWSLSGYPEEQSIASNGFLAGNELNELVEIYMDELVGGPVFDKFGNVFPLLIKILDTSDWLSIQVHPDDNLAKKRGLNGGKTEMWYIIDAERESKLISGFKEKINETVYLRKIEEKKLSEVLNFEDVQAKDVFYIPSGRVHALGPGILLAEIQQTSDTTYRIFDWDREDSEGKKRDLHLAEAMEAIDFEVPDHYKTIYSPELNKTKEIVNTPHFISNIIELNKGVKKDYSELDSFVILLGVEGNFDYSDTQDHKGNIKAGESLLIPSILDEISIYPNPQCKILEIYIYLNEEA